MQRFSVHSTHRVSVAAQQRTTVDSAARQPPRSRATPTPTARAQIESFACGCPRRPSPMRRRVTAGHSPLAHCPLPLCRCTLSSQPSRTGTGTPRRAKCACAALLDNSRLSFRFSLQAREIQGAPGPSLSINNTPSRTPQSALSAGCALRSAATRSAQTVVAFAFQIAWRGKRELRTSLSPRPDTVSPLTTYACTLSPGLWPSISRL